MVTVTINIKPYLAGYMYVRYRQSLEPDPENQSHSSSPSSSSKRLIPIHLSHITPVYHFLHQLSVPHPQNTQLIFTTHDTNLLSANIFRRDQVWFTQKDRYGATELYSLAEYKVRNDASFEKDYLSGKYGAIPIVGDLTRLFNTQEN